MELNKINTVLQYEFLLKHKNLKTYCENYYKYIDQLKNKYDLYTLVYINNIFNQTYNDEINDDELYIYLGINNDINNIKKHMFICCNIKLNLVYNEFGSDDKEIGSVYIINKINMPNEIYQMYIKCLVNTYEIVGY